MALALYVASPLILPVATGGVFAVLLAPLQRWLVARKLPEALAGSLVTLGLSLIVLLPMSFVSFLGVKAAARQVQQFRHAAPTLQAGAAGMVPSGDFFQAGMTQLETRFGLDPGALAEWAEPFQDVARGALSRAAEVAGGVLTALPGIAMALAIMVVSIYFFLVDGPRLVAAVKRSRLLPQDRGQSDAILGRLGDLCRSVVLASVASGGSQALVAGSVVAITRTPNAPLVGMLVFLGSFVPVIGAAPVTLGVALQQWWLGRHAVGVTLLLAAVVVGMVDNFVRPLFLKGTAQVHPLVAFVAAFGGLQTLGFMGVFLGPIAATMGLMILELAFEARGSQR